jgi:Ca2+/Na+ antiporter
MRMSGSRKCKTQRQYRSSVSRALWPTNIQHCVPTNKAAQRRRIIIMKGWGWISAWYKRITAKLSRWYAYIVAPVRQQLTTTLITICIILTMHELYQWYVWSPAIIICILVCATLCLMLSEKQHTSTTPRTVSPSQNEEARQRTAEPAQQVALFEFPETPMPSTPLIRVMETIDLSSSDVEHFIHTTSDQRPPKDRQTIEQAADGQKQHDV